MKIKMAIFVGNSGNAGTLLSFISICSHVPHERTLIWDKYEYTNLLIFSGLKKPVPRFPKFPCKIAYRKITKELWIYWI
jgi:hypothetical protein